MNRCIRKPTICICENKGADQLRSNCRADQCLCFRYTDSTIPFLFSFEISSFQPTSVPVQVGFICVGPGCWFSRAKAHLQSSETVLVRVKICGKIFKPSIALQPHYNTPRYNFDFNL